MDIFENVRNFRKAIDNAKSDDKFVHLSPFNNFPKECCEHTSDLLAQYLSEKGIITNKVNGSFKFDENWHHVWLLTEDDTIIDITGDQFIGKSLQLNEKLKSVYIGEEGELQKLFCLNRANEANINFINKNEFTGFNNQPSPYQKRLIEIYKIICEYL